MIDKYIEMNDWRVKENASRIYSYGGLKAYISETEIAKYALKKVYGEEAEKMHRRGDIHIHDLGHLTLYCAGYGVDMVICNGINGVKNTVWTDVPKHFTSALGQLMNFIFLVQQEQAGAVGLNCFDTYLAPYVRKDKLDYKAVKQAIQEFIYSINLPMRAGLESPFTNITFDGAVRDDLKDTHAIVGGEVISETYGDFEEEMFMIDKAVMDILYNGDSKGRVFTFPLVTINMTNNFNWDNEFGECVKKITAKYGIPYFQNMRGSDLRPSDVQSFCCRLRTDLRKAMKYGGIFGKPNATGSVGVVSINMPRIGYLSNGDMGEFERLLEERLEMARLILNNRRKMVNKFMEKGLYPYLKRYLGHLKWHFNTISIIGMHEAMLNMGYENGIIDDTRDAEKILAFILNKIDEYEKEDNIMWNFEQAPAESASGRLKDRDNKMFGKKMRALKVMNTNMSYTNSTHLPVNCTDDLFFILKHQERLNKYYTGGSVVHIWLQDRLNTESVSTIVDKITTKTKIPYFTLTPTYSICSEHGYIAGEVWKCPTCGKDTEVFSRIVGYYRPVQNWNVWKQEEFRNRKYVNVIGQ